MHPAYQLDSCASHDHPWRKPDHKPHLFSELPRNKAATSNEIERAKTYIVPDKVFYDPVSDGKRPWLKPEPNAIPIFSHLPLDDEWLSIHTKVENEEREARFYAAIRDDGYDGEDAFGGGGSTLHGGGATGGGGGGSSSSTRASRAGAHASGDAPPPPPPAVDPRSTTAMLTRLGTAPGSASLPPSLARRAEYDTKKAELLSRHALGSRAFEEAEREAQANLVAVTSRMKGKDSRKGTRGSGRAGSPGGGAGGATGGGRSVSPRRGDV